MGCMGVKEEYEECGGLAMVLSQQAKGLDGIR